MSGVNIEYKGESIATIPDTGLKTIKTQGKYCEGDILVEYEAPPTPTPTLQSKTVTPTTSQQSVTPDSGYDGLSDVTVNATPLEAKTVTPTSQQQVVTPTAPNIGLSSVTVGAAPQPTLITKQITANGTYTAADDNADGYSEVTVDVDTNASLDAYIQGDLKNIITNANVIQPYIFSSVQTLETISIPNVKIINNNVFYNCYNLTTINWSNEITIIYQYAFYGCRSLNISYLPSKLRSIGSAAFNGCSSIVSLDLSAVENIPTLAFSAFSGTTCTFLFRNQTQLDAYASATNWSTYADRFQIKEATP